MHFPRFDPAMKKEGRFSPLPEMYELERLVEQAKPHGRIKVLTTVSSGHLDFPIYALAFGSEDVTAPTLALFGGVHGLERIGSHVLLSYLKTVIELLEWDTTFRWWLKESRLLFVPLVNPVGMYRKTRSNGNGVDLMRNSPTQAEKISPLFLPGGHRLASWLPWYQGQLGAAMEPEAKAICEWVEQEVFASKTAITVDVHSGFGAIDRLWFPYAKTKRPFYSVAEVFALKALLDRTYPHHIYRVEPQSRQYRAHGDLWDHLYDEHKKKFPENTFLPMTLELGSWNWVKKDIFQIFSLLGHFNPTRPHRVQRTLRRHILFFEFLQRAVMAPREWSVITKDDRDTYRRRALELWYA